MPLDVVRRLLTPLRDPVATSRYPDAPPLLQPATRGLPEIDPLRCDRSGACASVCPTQAIQAVETVWSIDAGRCIFCGECAAACPQEAIRMGSRVELAGLGRTDLVERIELAPTAGSAQAVHSSTAEPSPSGAYPGASSADHVRSRLTHRLGRSLHVRHLDAGSCNGCDWEIAALLNPYHDVQRLGIDFVASPRHADLLLVTGVMTRNLEEAARRTFEAMPEPRLVVAVGACGISGGVFAGSATARGGAAGTLPVDVFVPGCPPRPEALIEGLLMAVEGRRRAAGQLRRGSRPGSVGS